MDAPGAIAIYVDADACPVKEEVYRVAERHGCASSWSPTASCRSRAIP